MAATKNNCFFDTKLVLFQRTAVAANAATAAGCVMAAAASAATSCKLLASGCWLLVDAAASLATGVGDGMLPAVGAAAAAVATAHSSLLATCYQLPAGHRTLFTTHCSVLTARYSMPLVKKSCPDNWESKLAP